MENQVRLFERFKALLSTSAPARVPPAMQQALRPDAPPPAPISVEETNAFLARMREELTNLQVMIGRPHPYHDVNQNVGVMTLTMIAEFLEKYLYANKKYTDSKRVAHFARKFYSMAGEDGIIREICRRIGVTDDGYFVEFGVDYHGLENNTLYLLLKGWKGLWIEAAPSINEAAEKSFRHHIDSGRLTLLNERVNAETIESLFKRGGVPAEPDVLSIDIDGNDYWVWQAITNYRPKVVVVEYNAVLGDDVAVVMPYKTGHAWEGSYYMGASLKALEKLGREKGYSLVGCDFHGVNAYFVRSDLINGQFEEPFTTANHYEPLRVFLTRGGGSLLGFGKFEFV